MGNCCGSSSKLDMQQQDYFPLEEADNQAISFEDYNDHHEHNVTTSTTRSNTPFHGTPVHELTPTTKMLPLVNPRLVSLLDFFRQLYSRRKDIFDKVMPVHRHKFEVIFNEMRDVQQLEKRNSKMGGVVRMRSLSVGDEKDLKKERFKVKPIDSGGVPSPSDGKVGGGCMPAGPKK